MLAQDLLATVSRAILGILLTDIDSYVRWFEH